MRYLVQLLIPALIFAGVVYLLMRRRRHDRAAHSDEAPRSGSDTGSFVVILLVSAAVALGTGLLLQSLWE